MNRVVALTLLASLLGRFLVGGVPSAAGLAGPPTGKHTDKPAKAADQPAKVADPTAPPKVEDPIEITIGPEGISVFAVAVDAHALLVRLAQDTGLRVVVDDTVNRTMTVNLVNQKVTEALNNIVSAYGLSCREVNGIYMISEGIPKTPSSYLLSDIEAISTQYVLAPTAKSLLPIFLQDHVKTNQEQNSVILSAPPDVLKKFRQDIKQFDIPASQIMIEVLMVEFTDSAAKQFSLGWTWSNQNNTATVDSAFGQIFFRTITALPDLFSANLKALVTKGRARVRANPRIATVSGQTATIFIGNQRYLSTPVSVSGGDQYSMMQQNSIDAGVNLLMTPWTGGEGEVIVDIHPEISVLSAPDATTGLPDKSTRRANTTVHVRDGETIVIGGLVQHESITTHTKVPLLGDIPLIGQFFRTHDDHDSATELVIFITPHILSQTGHLPADQEKKLKERFIDDAPPRKAGSLFAFWCLGTFAAAQGVPYCNVTGIDVKRLSNGVQVTIQADGLMQFSYNYADYLNLEAVQLGNWNQVTKPVTVLPFRIVNARSKVGSVADIGVYPASHVEISIPAEAQDGIGLDFKVVLLAEAVPLTVGFRGEGFQFSSADLTHPIVRITASQDKRSLIILIESDRQVETPVKLRAPAEDALKELSVEKSGDRLSIHALNADLRDVIREISNQSGRSILAADDLLHYVTLNLPGVTVGEALDALAIGYGVSVQASGSTTLVGEGKIGSLSSFGGSVTESLHLQYLSAFAARNSLPDFMMSFVHVNGDQNALTLSGPRPLVEKLRRDLEKLDQPIPQIEVETTAVEFGSTHDVEALADLDGRLKASEVGMKTATGDVKIVFAGALPDAFSAQIHALEAQSKATVRAHAKSVVLSGQTSDLFAGQRQLVQIQYFDNFLGVFTARIITLDLGMTVKVKPWSGGGGTIMVNVQPSVTSVVDKEVGTGLPTLSTRSANATLRLQTGETVMIGGLRMSQIQRIDRGIPGLSSLGLLGLPFQAPKKTRSETELVFFVTARIVAGRPYVPPSLGAATNAGTVESHL